MVGSAKKPSSSAIRVLTGLVCVAALILAKPTRVLAVEMSLLGIYFFYIIMLLRGGEISRYWASLPTLTKSVTVASTLPVVVFLGLYIGGYDFVPYWDTLNYWRKAIELDAAFESSIHQTLVAAVATVNTQDYNDLMGLVLTPVARVLPEWKSFVFSLVPLFAMPMAVVIALFICVRAASQPSSKTARWVVPLTTFCLSCAPLVWVSIPLEGHQDVVAALLFTAVFVSLFDRRLTLRGPAYCLLLGVGLSGAFLLRRWMVYGIVGGGVAALVYQFLLARRDDQVRPLLRRVLLVAIGAAVVLVPFSGFVVRSVTGGYSEAYAAWTVYGTIGEKAMQLPLRVGPILVIMAIVALVLLAATHSMRSCDCAVVAACIASAFISCLLFWCTQDLSPHHYYIVAAPLLIAVFLPIMTVLASVSAAALAPAGALIAVASALVLMSETGCLSVSRTLFGPTYVRQSEFIQSDADVVRRFVRDLNFEVREGEMVYFAAASPKLNSSVVDGVLLPKDKASFELASSDVDSRDGFNTSFFDSRYVVTSNPAQLHMPEESERVVVTLNTLVQDCSSFVGSHYELVSEYPMDGVTTRVFRRVSDFTADDVRRLRDTFDAMYPDRPELFRDRFDAYLEGTGL